MVIFLLFVAAFVLPEVTVYFNRPGRGSDIAGYFAAGRDALHRAQLYEHTLPGKNNTWPPFFSVFMIPLSLVKSITGVPIAKELWYFFNFFCLIGTVKVWTEMLYGKRPKFCSKTRFDFSSPKVFTPLLLVLPPLVNNFFMLQINVFILFLVTFGFYSMTKNRSLAAGLSFGLAASLKAFPGLVVLYLLARRQWKTAGYAVLAGILFSLIPIFIYGVHDITALFKQWLSISLAQTLIVDNGNHNNQSIYALCYRFLVYQSGITEPGSTLLKSVNLLMIGLIALVTLAICALKRFKQKDFRTTLEFSCICILMNIFPPIAWKHYFVFLYPAAAVMWAAYNNYRELFHNKMIKALALIWPLLLLFPYCAGRGISRWFQSYSNYTIASIMALLLLLVLVYKANREQSGFFKISPSH